MIGAVKKYIIGLLTEEQSIFLSRLKKNIQKLVRRFSTAINTDDLLESLRCVNIKQGDSLYIHSSMSKVGNLEYGANTVIEALIQCVGKQGTIGVPCHLSPESIKEKNNNKDLLDLRLEPPHTGIIAKTIKDRKGSYCSSHPYASSCFLGKNARWITTGHDENFRVYHKHSPMHKLMDLDGKIIGIGIDFAAIGFYHLIEDVENNYPIEVYDEKFIAKYIDSHGNIITRYIATYNKSISRTRVEKKDGMYSRKILLKYLTDNNAIYFFKFGKADAWVLDCKKTYNVLLQMLNDGLTIYTEK